MATNFIPLSNSAAEVSPIGRIVRKGIRFNPGTDSRQAVLNIKMAVKRSYLPRAEGSKWVNVNQYYDMALWGDRATSLAASLERYGALETLPEAHEIRVKCTFNLADVVVKPWGGDNGQEPRYDLTARANAIEIVSVADVNHQNAGETTPEQFVPAPEVEEVTFVL